jgi:omega-6 fatty acid desaturase (delta-12 desaturase)
MTQHEAAPGREASVPRTTRAFTSRTEGISTADLLAAIPADCFEPRVGRGLLAIGTSAVFAGLAYAALALNPYWWLLPPLWLAAGTTVWGFYVIGHECGHGSFSRSRRLNYFVGHLMLTPLLYPFHSWRLLHNHHHANTNNIENDMDWRPLPAALFRHLPWRPRNIYRLNRTTFWWAGSLYHLATRGFSVNSFPPGRSRSQVRFSILMVVLFAAAFFPALVYWTGFWGLVKYWLIPWLLVYAWFSTITLTHHTHPDIPYLNKARWSPVMASLTMTVYCRYPRWAEFLGHDITVHIPHHVAPTIPFYNLRRAHAALRERWPALVTEIPFSWRYLFHLLSTCHLNDLKTGFYVPFSAVQAKRR